MLMSTFAFVLSSLAAASASGGEVTFADPGATSSGKWSEIRVKRGDDIVTLDAAAFYALIGRDDLVLKLKSRRTKKLGLSIGGGIAVGVGAMLSGLGATQYAGCPGARYAGSSTDAVVTYARSVVDQVHCRQNAGGVLAAGVLVAVAGAVTGIVGIAMREQPISAADAAALMDKYNEAQAAGSNKPLAFGVAPTIGVDNLGFALAGAF